MSDATRRAKTVQRLIDRDGDGCFYCGITFGRMPGQGFEQTIDHYMPRHMGGSRKKIENLRLACFYCNHLKGEKDPNVFLASASLAVRRENAERWERKAHGLHPRREGYWHPPTSIYRVRRGHLGCRTCGAVGSPDEHLDVFPCLIYRPYSPALVAQ